MSEAQQDESKFVYVTYIRTTPEKLWGALTQPEFTRKYWFDTAPECDWKVGSTWKLSRGEMLMDNGEVVAVDPPRKLVLKWRNEFRPELKAEGYGQATFDLELMGETVKLTVTHVMPLPKSKFVEAVGTGWPMVLSGLKSLLETGEVPVMKR